MAIFIYFLFPETVSQLHVRSKVCMAPFHARSKVCIAPIHVQSKVCQFAPHMDASHADFAQHMEWRHSFRDQKMLKLQFLLLFKKRFFQTNYNLEVFMAYVTIFEKKNILKECSFKEMKLEVPGPSKTLQESVARLSECFCTTAP